MYKIEALFKEVAQAISEHETKAISSHRDFRTYVKEIKAIADNPTSALDSKNVNKIEKILDRARRAGGQAELNRLYDSILRKIKKFHEQQAVSKIEERRANRVNIKRAVDSASLCSLKTDSAFSLSMFTPSSVTATATRPMAIRATAEHKTENLNRFLTENPPNVGRFIFHSPLQNAGISPAQQACDIFDAHKDLFITALENQEAFREWLRENDLEQEIRRFSDKLIHSFTSHGPMPSSTALIAEAYEAYKLAVIGDKGIAHANAICLKNHSTAGLALFLERHPNSADCIILHQKKITEWSELYQKKAASPELK